MASKFLSPNIIFTGENALELAKEDIIRSGNKALIVTDSMMVKLGITDKVTNILNDNKLPYHIYSEVNSEPTDKIVAEGTLAYRKENCDFIIAVGGGSPIDTAKAINLEVSTGKKITNFEGGYYTGQLTTLIAIPTTAGTGSEATQFTIINDTQRDVKMLISGSSLIPEIAIVDPYFTLTTPKHITAATGIDALCHAVESYTSRKSQPLSEIFAISAIQKIFNNLRKCYEEPDNISAREKMSAAALEAGISFNNSSVTIVHGMSRPIGALYHIPHGLSNAILLETCLNHIKESINDKLAEIARKTGMTTDPDDEVASEIFMKELHVLLQDLNIMNLEELKIDNNDFSGNIDKMSNDAIASGSCSNCIMEIQKDDVIRIYSKLL